MTAQLVIYVTPLESQFDMIAVMQSASGSSVGSVFGCGAAVGRGTVSVPAVLVWALLPEECTSSIREPRATATLALQ